MTDIGLMELHQEAQVYKELLKRSERDFNNLCNEQLIEAFGYVNITNKWFLQLDYNLYVGVSFDTDYGQWVASGCVPKTLENGNGFESTVAKDKNSPATALKDLLFLLNQINPEAVQALRDNHAQMLKRNNINHTGI